MPDLPVTTARCQCGQVEIEARGEPILAVACHCDDCQEGGRRIEALPGAPPVLGPAGGTDYLLFRRDRFRVARGAERLQEIRLKPGSKTKRVVAGCCNAALYLDYAPGHWITAFRAPFGPAARPIEMRVMTRFAPAPLPADGVPAHPGFSWRFLARVLAAWPPMLLRRP